MKVKLNRDSKLVSRMYFTWFLLGILYAFFMLILNAFGVQFGFIAFIVIIFGSVQYFMSDKMVLWSSGAKLIERQDDERLFQIVDDIIDFRGDSRIAGKPTKRDKKKGKPTLINLIGYNKTIKFANIILGNGPDSIAESLRCINESAGHSLIDGLNLEIDAFSKRFGTDETDEG